MISKEGCSFFICSVKPTGIVDFIIIVLDGHFCSASEITDSTEEVLKKFFSLS